MGNREYPILRALAFFHRIITQPVGHLLRDEHDFVFLAALRLSENQFSILNGVSLGCLKPWTRGDSEAVRESI
jgi:hypothetical protein